MASNQEEDEVWRQSGCCFVKLPGNLRKSIFCYFPGLVNKNASKYRYDNKALPSNEKDQSNEINNPTRNVNSYTQNINYCHESASPITNSDICYMEVEVVYCIMLFYVRFASQPDGSAWPGKYFYTFLRQSSAALPWSGDHGGWVCSTYPMEGTLTYDCLPEVSLTLTPSLALTSVWLITGGGPGLVQDCDPRPCPGASHERARLQWSRLLLQWWRFLQL